MDLRKRIIITALLLVATTASHALPIIGAIGTAVTGAIASITLGQVLFMGASLLFGSAQQRKLKKKALADQRRQKDEYNAGLSDRTVNGIGSEFPARQVFGRARIGGNIVDIITSGDRDQYQHVIALGPQHQIDDFEEIYINGKAVGALDLNGFAINAPFGKSITVPKTTTIAAGSNSITLPSTPVSGSIVVTVVAIGDYADAYYNLSVPFTESGGVVTVDAAYNANIKTVNYSTTESVGSIRITKHLGVPGGSYDVNTNVETGGKLKTTSVFEGHAYVAIRFDLDEPEFQNLPAIEFLIKRTSLYDVRTGTVVNGSGSNPALVAHEYLKGPLCDIESITLPTAQYITAANDCDVIVNNGDGDRKRYTFNGMISSDQSREEVLQRIADSMAGGIVATTWDIYAGVYRAPIMTLNETDIVGSLSVSPGASELEIFNTVYGRYASAENAYLEKDYRRYVQSTYVADDGGELEVGITYPFTITQTEVDQLNRIATEQARQDFTITALFSLKAWKLKVGDRVFWTSPFMGQTSQVYRIVDRLSGNGVGVTLTLKQDNAEMYDLLDAVTAPSTPPSVLPNPWFVQIPSDLTLQSGNSVLTAATDGTLVAGLRVEWTNASSDIATRGNYIDVEFERLTGANLPDVVRFETTADRNYFVLKPAQEGETYRVAVRGRNSYNSAVSPWAYSPLHVVLGKTEPPPDVVNFTISDDTLVWSAVEVSDIDGYLIRYQFGNNAWWDSATPLHLGLLTGSPYTITQSLSGTITFLIKAVDRSGNESQNAAVIFKDLGDSFVQNILVDYPEAPIWGGLKTNCTVSAGDLIATATDLFYGPDIEPFYGQDTDAFYALATFATATYEWSADISSPGTVLIDIGITASQYNLEYRRDNQSSFYGESNDFFYGLDGDYFYGAAGDWQPWPGSLPIESSERLDFRLTMSGGVTQGVVDLLTVQLDVPDIEETLNDITISALGTRLPITKNYRVIKNVLVTIQSNGGTAVTARVVDKHPTAGPLINTLNASGTAVTGLIDARIQGY